MAILIITSLVAVVAVLYISRVIYGKIPDLKNLDISSLSDEKKQEIRRKILEAKLYRSNEKLRKKLGAMIEPKKEAVIASLDSFKGWVASLEAKYKPESKEHKIQTVEQLFTQADELITKDNFAEAEKALIEIIGKNKKSVKAYEKLGELYFNNRNYDQAEEIYQHLIKLKTLKGKVKKGQQGEAEIEALSSLGVDSKVGVYYDDLGQIYEITGKQDKALDSYLKCSAIEPNNPKYLDKLIDLAIKLDDKGLAKKSLNRLKEINPENGKLAELAAAIEKMK